MNQTHCFYIKLNCRGNSLILVYSLFLKYDTCCSPAKEYSHYSSMFPLIFLLLVYNGITAFKYICLLDAMGITVIYTSVHYELLLTVPETVRVVVLP